VSSKTKILDIRFFILALLGACTLPEPDVTSTRQEVTVITDAAAFLAATHSTLKVDFPSPTSFSTSTYIENGVTLRQVDGFRVGVFANRSARTPGNEFALSGPESMNISLPGPESIFGMYVEDSTTDPSSLSVCPKTDSSFTYTFKSGGRHGSVVAVVNVDPPVNQQFFVGVISPSTFDYIEVREDGALPGENVGPHCENDYFGDIYLGGSVDSDGDGVTNDMDLCADTAIPEASVPESGHLNPNHYAVLTAGGLFARGEPRGKGDGADTEFSLNDTRGCSCEQIIESMEIGEGHRKYGCSRGIMLEWLASLP
jgi:hypothetical protein